MSASKKQRSRERGKDSGRRKGGVSIVEVAYIVDSYLSENNFVRTLAEFRVEAASLLSRLKNGAPFPVKSLTSVLGDYVVMLQEHRAAILAKSQLEEALKKEQMVVGRGKTGFQVLMRQFHDSVAAYEAAWIPPDSPPQQLQQPVPALPMAQGTPPDMGVRQIFECTPGSVSTAITTTESNKRKRGLRRKTEQVTSVGTNAPAAKKARLLPIPPNSPRGPLPSLCGGIRKTSVMTVRPVPSNSCDLATQSSDPNGLFPHPAHPMAFVPGFPPVSAPQGPSSDPQALPQWQSLAPPPPPSAPPPSDLSTPTKGTGYGIQPDPRTPSTTPPSPPTDALTSQSIPHPHCGPADEAAAREGGPGPGPGQHLPSDRRSISQSHRQGGGLRASKADGQKGKRNGKTTAPASSPDSRVRAGTRGMKPSKTMRPLNFSSEVANGDENALVPVDNALVPVDSLDHENNPVGSLGDPATFPFAPSDESHLEPVNSPREADNLQPSMANLSSIDDILDFDNNSYSELAGMILDDDDVCPGTTPISIGNEFKSSLIGEDSLGFDYLLDQPYSCNAGSPRPKERMPLSGRDMNASDDGLRESSPSQLKRTPPRSAETTRTSRDKENILA